MFADIKKWLQKWWWLVAILIVAAGLRLYRLNQLPVAPYWEEVALGYDAWSILQTGRDHHGTFLPVVAFESFGDWKPVGYFYALVPFLAVFKLTVLAVRLPSALAGVAIVAATATLAYLMTRRRMAALWVAWITTFSSWAILFSRGGWEVNLATALIAWGVVCLVVWLRKQDWGWLIAGTILLSLAASTYHAARFVAPSLGLVFVSIKVWRMWRGQLFKGWQSLVLAGVIAIVLNGPWLASFQTGPASQRLAETSALTDISIIENVNALQSEAGHTWWAKLLYHRYWAYGRIMAENALSHFHPDFLFITGDTNPRHSTQYFGLLYPLDALLLVIGLLAVWRWSRWRALLAAWVLITLVPVSMTRATPHALRILPMLPAVMLILSLGAFELTTWLQSWYRRLKISKRFFRATIVVAMLAYAAQWALFWHHYSTVYAVNYAQEWQYGYESMIKSLTEARAANPDLTAFVSRAQGRPAMYYWFYTQADPELVQADQGQVATDQGERLAYTPDNIVFVDTWANLTSPALVAVPASQFTELETTYPDLTVLSQINDLNNKPVWYVVKL